MHAPLQDKNNIYMIQFSHNKAWISVRGALYIYTYILNNLQIVKYTQLHVHLINENNLSSYIMWNEFKNVSDAFYCDIEKTYPVSSSNLLMQCSHIYIYVYAWG